MFQGFFQSVRVISSSRISCNRWSRRSWSAAAPPSLLCICVRFASLISAISSRSFLIRSDTSLGINSLMNGKPQLTELHGWKLSSLCFYFGFQFSTAVSEFQRCFTHYGCSCAMRWALDFLNRFDYRPADLRLCVRISTKFNFHSQRVAFLHGEYKAKTV